MDFNSKSVNILEIASIRTIFNVFMLLMLTSLVSCAPLEDPIKCTSGSKNCTITNTYGMFPDRTKCHAAEVGYPRTEAELVSIVSMATEKKTKIKVATRFGHSVPKLVCPDGKDGLLVSTKFLNRVLEIDKSKMTMRMESGVVLRDLISKAAEAGLALPHAPYWWGLTIGGLLSTGAHGSSLLGYSAVHEHVVELRIVTPGEPKEGYAKIRKLNITDPDLNAAKVSLGVLGVISQVTLKLEPMFKRSITYSAKSDSDLADEIVNFGKKHEFADLTWYPSQEKVVYRIDDRVPSNSSGNGLYDSTGFRSTATLGLALLRTIEESLESGKDAAGKCTEGKLITWTLDKTAYGLTNNGYLFTGYPVVGYNNRIQSSGGCVKNANLDPNIILTSCPWDPRVKGLFYHQTAFSVAVSKVKSFIQDVQKLVQLDTKSLCGVELYNGILMRYVKASSAYLGKQEDTIDFDFTYYRSKDPMVPRMYEDILEEIEQMGVFKYEGLPHWGKNRNIAFHEVIKKYGHAKEFLKVKDAYDPLGIFSNDWTDNMLGLRDGLMIVKEGCGLEGLCLCSEDSHCAPSKGYYCRPGKIYTDARVCTYTDVSSISSSDST